MDKLVLPKFDDMHLHLRDGAALARTVYDSSRWAARALIMPNLTPAVDTLTAVASYRERILAALPEGREFTPLMSLYFSTALTAETIRGAKAAGVVAVKWYPKGATTNSAQGVADIQAMYPLLEEIQKAGLLFLIHGEVTDKAVDIFDREAVFIDMILKSIRAHFPELKIVLEHITTHHAVDYVLSQPKNLAATITPQHLLFNRNELLVGGIKPHYYCLPILKTERDRKALLNAATSGDARFFLGTDSAPHTQHSKECACGCAGCYSAASAPVLYAEAFAEVGALDKLRAFATEFGADYYGLPRNQGTITLKKVDNAIPEFLPYMNETVVPLAAGRQIHWQLSDE